MLYSGTAHSLPHEQLTLAFCSSWAYAHFTFKKTEIQRVFYWPHQTAKSHDGSSFQLFGKEIKHHRNQRNLGIPLDSRDLVPTSSLMTGQWVFPLCYEMAHKPQLVLTVLAPCCVFLLHLSHWGICHHAEQSPVKKYFKESQSRESRDSRPV